MKIALRELEKARIKYNAMISDICDELNHIKFKCKGKSCDILNGDYTDNGMCEHDLQIRRHYTNIEYFENHVKTYERKYKYLKHELMYVVCNRLMFID
jgi:hypothetical protein